MILILILAPPTLGARGHLPHLPSPSYATAVTHVFFILLHAAKAKNSALGYFK